MALVQRRRSPFPPRWMSLSCLAIFFVFSITVSRGGPENLVPLTDVNAPPVQKPGIAHSSNHSQPDAPMNSQNRQTNTSYYLYEFFWGQRQTQSNPQPQNGDKVRKTKKPPKPIPIVQEDDDSVPHAAVGAVVRAADALLCSNSVVDFVINATDSKDECDGLKKAFTKNCAGDAEASLNGHHDQQRRRLQRVVEPSPVRQWQYRIYRWTHAFQRWMNPEQQHLLLEDAIVQQWGDSKYIVENNWDGLMEQDGELDGLFEAFKASAQITRDRRLNQAKAFDLADRYLDKQEEAERAKVTATTVNETSQGINSTVSSPSKPFVSEEALGDTLILQGAKLGPHKAPSSDEGAANQNPKTGPERPEPSGDTVPAPLPWDETNAEETRTCCTSIISTYHDYCSVGEDDEISDRRLFIVVAVIALCGLVKSLIRHFHIRWLPEAAGCILVGVGSGWILTMFPHHDVSFDGPWFLRIMVPPIVFEAALSIDKRAFNRHVVPIFIYAILGTLFATGLTAFVLHEGSKYFHGYCETIPMIEALTFGALISSIDPIAVLSVLSNMGMSDTHTIYVVIFGESLLNDGVAIVLFQTLVHFLDVHMHVNGHAVAAAAIHFCVVAVGSLLVGLGSGLCCTVYYWLMQGCQTPLVEVLLFCCWALLPYYVCDGIEWSGIVAVVAAGFVMDIYVVGGHPMENAEAPKEQDVPSSPSSGNMRGRRRQPLFSTTGLLSDEAKTHVGFVTEIIATMMETAIFAYLGLFLFSSRYHWNNYHTAIAISACCISRAIMIPVLSTLANWITKLQRVRARCRHYKLPQADSVNLSTTDVKNGAAGVIIDRKMQLVLWFAGLRGAMSFALVENIPLFDSVSGTGTRLKSELKAMTSACIMFTVFVLGGLTYYMMEGLGLAPTQEKAGETNTAGKESEMVSLLGRNGVNHDDNHSHSEAGYEQHQEGFPSRRPTTGPKHFRQRATAT
eukprot:Nitzschia sp. Nitz4//scaffold4_size323378//48168//51131//NITZ4_000625-RA/size323378-snap-gene-0.441-mRNA-1//-1//CDS//3329553294//1941//frame0